jgi:hypothetical protein
MRRLMPLIALLLAVAALSGCAGAGQNTSAGSFKGAEHDVAQVVDDLKASRDPEEVCSRIFTDAFAKSLEAGGQDCVDEVQATIRDTADTDMDVDDVAVTGDRATAKVSQGKRTATFELEKTRDGWQISSLGGAS